MLSASELANFRCGGDSFPLGSDASPAVFGPPANLSEVFLQRLFEEVLMLLIGITHRADHEVPHLNC